MFRRNKPKIHSALRIWTEQIATGDFIIHPKKARAQREFYKQRRIEMKEKNNE